MKKDLEQLRLNMIRSLMEMDYESLMKVKTFLESDVDGAWTEFINDDTVEFIDYSKISKISDKKEDKKVSIVFL